MATTRPFAFNTGATISGTEQVGNLAVGVTNQPYSLDIGNVKWWMGPDEDLGYIIAHQTNPPTQPTEIPGITAGVGFWRSSSLTDQSFINLCNCIPPREGLTPFSTTSACFSWLNSNGYWTSYPSVVSSGLILNWNIQSSVSYPGTGTTIVDLEGNSNGIFVGSVTYTGGSPNYLLIEGSNTEYVRTVTNLNPDLSPPNTGTDISIFLWVYPTENGIILSEQGSTSLNTNWYDSQIEMVSGVIRFGVWNGSGISYTSSSISTPLNNWYYLGFAYSGTTLTSYVNGQSAGTVTVTRQTPYNNGGYLPLYYFLGAPNSTNMGDGTGMTLRFGEMKIYNRGLTSSEVLQNYNNSSSQYISPTPTPTNTPTITPSQTVTNTPTPTPSPTITPSPTVTSTITSTPTPTITPTVTSTITSTPTTTTTPTVTSTTTSTPTPTITPTVTPSEPFFLLFEDSSIATAENNDSIEINYVDVIKNSLTTSLSSYISATVGNWVEVTSTEYNSVKNNVLYLSTYGMTNAEATASGGGSWNADCAFKMSSDRVTTSTGEYLIGFLARLATSASTGTFTLITGSTYGGTYSAIANSPILTGNDLKYFVRKAPTVANSSTTYVGSVSTAPRYYVGNFVGSGYDCSSPYSTWSTWDAGAPVFQFIGTTLKQW